MSVCFTCWGPVWRQNPTKQATSEDLCNTNLGEHQQGSVGRYMWAVDFSQSLLYWLYLRLYHLGRLLFLKWVLKRPEMSTLFKINVLSRGTSRKFWMGYSKIPSQSLKVIILTLHLKILANHKYYFFIMTNLSFFFPVAGCLHSSQWYHLENKTLLTSWFCPPWMLVFSLAHR